MPALQLCPTCAPLLMLRNSRNTLLTSAPLRVSASSKVDSPRGYTEPDADCFPRCCLWSACLCCFVVLAGKKINNHPLFPVLLSELGLCDSVSGYVVRGQQPYPASSSEISVPDRCDLGITSVSFTF